MDWEKAINIVIRSLKVQGLSSDTIKSYEYDYKSFACYKKDVPPSHIQKLDIQDYVMACKEHHISNQTINRKIIALRTFYDQLMELDFVTDNPARKTHLLKVRKDKTHKALTLDQSEKLTSILSLYPLGNRHVLSTLLMVRMGLRIGELVKLDITDIDRHRGVLRVLGKGNKIRELPIPSDLMPYIQDYIDHFRYYYAKPNERALFVTRRGTRISVRTLHYWFHKSVKEAGLYDQRLEPKQRITPHKMRHTFAVQAIKGGVDVLTLKEILGHENLETTNIYAQADQDRIRFAMEQHPMRSLTSHQ